MLRFPKLACALSLAAWIVTPSGAVAQTAASAAESPEETEAPACVRDGTDQVAPYRLGKGRTIAQAINAPLTDEKGSAIAGRELMVRADRGNCTACHRVADIRKKARTADSTSVTRFGLQGTIGPALDGVAQRFTEGELRLLVVNPQTALPKAKSIMPAYHHVKDRKRVLKGCEGRVILTAGEVEDIVAYLVTLTEDAQ